MNEVAILGIGQMPVREHWDKSVTDLAVQAGRSAMAEAGVDRIDGLFLGNMSSGSMNQQRQLATRVAEGLGQSGVEAVKLEAACGSAGMAMRQGIFAIASGMFSAVLVVGVEKMKDVKGAQASAALAQAADAEYEIPHGISFVSLNALIMQRYMHEYGYEQSDFAPFALNAHANGEKNENALFRKAISAKTYQYGRIIADPMTLYDASPMGDGAAAVLLVNARKAKSAVRVLGSAAATDTLAVHDRPNPLWLAAAERSSQQVYRQATITPADIDIFELHDAFSIMAAMSLEATGFAEQGQGIRVAQAGDILPSGRIPISTMGGLKARGHPVGATGLYQIVEATLQLREQAGLAQIDGVRTAMTQNIGGSGATIVTHLLGIED